MLIDKKLINEAKEKLGDDNYIHIMESLGIDDYDLVNKKNLCPFHDEDTPSFIYNSKAYFAHCFGCNKTIDIIDAFMHTDLTYLEAVQKLFELANIKYSFSEYKVKTKYRYRYPKEIICTNKDKVYDYLAKRKISKETIDYVDIRQDTSGNIVFNYYDLNDILLMVKYRPSKKLKKGERKNWCQPDADTTPILYNINKINTNNPLMITSGEIDCLSAIEAGYSNVVSIPLGDNNLHWVKECWDFLEQFEQIYICTDNDKSGLKFQKDIIYQLGSWRTKIVKVPEYYEKENGTKIPVKDLNEVLYWFGKEKVLEIINDAQDTPVQSVNDLSDVDDLDLSEIDGIETGFKSLDRELMKFFYGTLTIISGTPGSGKSSLICQLICNALDQGKNCWLFSGEMPEYMVKNWFKYIFAGNRNMNEYELPNYDKYYKVTPQAKNQIDETYKGRWFIYKDDYDNNLDSLIISMTDVVRKYGVKFLIIDNMMTIDVDDSNEELREQTKTIKRLIAFSKKYNVATVLIAHPRKLANTSTVGIYDIAGTANIANLAHRTLGMRRVTSEEKDGTDNDSKLKKYLRKYDVVINIIKDRLRGRSHINLGLYYDIPSRRFYTTYDEYDHQYKWDVSVYKDKIEYPKKDESEEIFGRV